MLDLVGAPVLSPQVTTEHVKAVVDRLKAGKLSLIALHSAHWSKPFIEAMNERAIEDALKRLPSSERGSVQDLFRDLHRRPACPNLMLR